MWRGNRKNIAMPKKNKKNNSLKDDSKLIIELEDNAEELFASAIEGDWKPYEHEDEFFEQEKKSSKGKSSKLNRKIDLHGKTVSEAQRAVSNLMEELRQQYTGVVSLKVITGKGLHSKQGVGVLSRQTCATSGVTGISLTKLDVLDGFKKLKICIGYELDGNDLDYLPTAADQQARCKPIYEEISGWDESTEGSRSWADLPANAIKYVRRIEELIDCPVALVSTSPERDDTILVTDPFED